MKFPGVLLLVASTAGAQPIDVNVNGPLHDLTNQLNAASPCRFMGMGSTQVNIAMTKVSVWDVLAKIEAQHKVYSRISGGTIFLDPNARSQPNPRDPVLTWASDWQRRGSWAVAYLPGPRFIHGGRPPDERSARIMLLGTQGYVVEKVVIERAVADKKVLAVETSLVTKAPRACDPATVDLKLQVPKPIARASFRGHVVVKVPRVAERRVAIPFNDDVVDIAEGRLRVHVASRPHGTAGQREVYISWDGMGEPVSLKVDIVDEHGQPVTSNSHSSGSSNSQGREARVVTWTTGKLYAVLKLPTKAAPLEQKIPFKFDNVLLDKPGP